MDSFDSSQGTYAATKQNNGGNIGTNGNIRLSGDVKVDGTASTPYSGTDACTSQSLTALTSSERNIYIGKLFMEEIQPTNTR